MKEKKSIALFDFDGTITKKDSLKEFLIYSFGYKKYFLALIILSPILILYILKVIPNYKAKEILFQYFFKNMSEKEFLEKSFNYSLNSVDLITKDIALKKILWHKNRGDRLIIISASIEEWIKPWAIKNGFETVLGTKLEIINNQLTGKFSNKNCYGIEKVNRIKKYIPDYKNFYFYAYGDSRGDKELLEFADDGYLNYKQNPKI